MTLSSSNIENLNIKIKWEFVKDIWWKYEKSESEETSTNHRIASYPKSPVCSDWNVV